MSPKYQALLDEYSSGSDANSLFPDYSYFVDNINSSDSVSEESDSHTYIYYIGIPLFFIFICFISFCIYKLKDKILDILNNTSKQDNQIDTVMYIQPSTSISNQNHYTNCEDIFSRKQEDTVVDIKSSNSTLSNIYYPNLGNITISTNSYDTTFDHDDINTEENKKNGSLDTVSNISNSEDLPLDNTQTQI